MKAIANHKVDILKGDEFLQNMFPMGLFESRDGKNVAKIEKYTKHKNTNHEEEFVEDMMTEIQEKNEESTIKWMISDIAKVIFLKKAMARHLDVVIIVFALKENEDIVHKVEDIQEQ
jgi:hypothetical protein